MIAIENCRDLATKTSDYLEAKLTAEERGAVDRHLANCPDCSAAFKRFAQVQGLLHGAFESEPISAEFKQKAGEGMRVATQSVLAVQTGAQEPVSAPLYASLVDRMGTAPWWAVSMVLHVLVITLLGLITMSIGILDDRNSVIVLTNLEKMSALKPVEETKKSKTDLRDILEAKQDTPPTDPNAQVQSNIVVPPDILAKAELGDHFETINLDRPDTQSAFGNPDARMFHSASGNDEREGGGGLGGTSLMDDLIGMGGSASPGTGGGWGGGNGTGTGVGNGAGHGSFGQRSGGGRRLMVMKHGGSKATESAVDLALEWLARHQEADGRWDHLKHGGAGQYHGGVTGDAAMTGFALLAFLGAGHTEKIGKYKEHVRRGLLWLLEKQGKVKDGQWNKHPHEGRWTDLNYTHGIATMALSEAAAMGRNAEMRKAAQKAIDGVEYAQNRADNESERWAWDYFPKGGTNDASIMAWNVLALKSGKVAGLKVDPACFEGTIRWIDHAQILDPHKGKDHIDDYDWLGGLMPYRGKPGAVNGVGGWATMAAAALCRVMFGGAALDHPGVLGPCNKIKVSNLPKGYPYNLYYGYYAALLMFQKGGDHWAAWNEAMKPALLNGQRKGGPKDGSAADVDGSWDYGAETACESRVMSTCLAVLSLEVYYRYLPIYK